MNIIYENQILQYTNEENEKIRVIWISSNYEYCYCVNIYNSTSMPTVYKISDIEDKLNQKEMVSVPDPFCYGEDENDISEEHRQKRDKTWEIVEFLWGIDKSLILLKSSRNKTIKVASEKFGVSEKQIRRILSRFWQRGMVKNALLPDYENRGGKGKRKKINSKINENTGELEEIKRGRERKPNKSGIIIKGKNIDDDKLNIIMISIKLFYKKGRTSISQAYTDMITKFFSDKYKVGGKVKLIVQSKEKRITYDQFYYWLKKYENEKYRELFIARHSQKEFDLKLRELLKNSTMETFGPGSRYQIDATVVGVYLVSIINRNKIVGKPVVYTVIDVYSRLIVGIHVCLEGPSWGAAMIALYNVVEDKVEYCKRFGIDISSKEWPNSLLAEKIIADNGEFQGYNPENLINNLDVHVENTATYRGDQKGIVERNFRTTKEKVKHKTPGAIQKEYRERGDKDYRLDATLNLNEFTAIIIQNVIRHNNSIIRSYPRERGLIADEVAPVPVEIWNWGIKKRKCAFKHIEKNNIKRNLLYKGVAIIKREGIKFDSKLFYSCDEAIQEDWFVNCIDKKVNIVYDPNDMDNIFIPINKGKEFITCNLLEKCSAYKGLPLEEIIFQEELESEIIEDYSDNQIQRNVDYLVGKQNIINKAAKEKKKYFKLSKRSRLKNIRLNRFLENKILKERNKNSFDEKEVRKDLYFEESISSNTSDCTDTFNNLDLFKSVRKEHKND